MKKLYREYFYVPKHGKVCEKVMRTRMALTIAVMAACLAAMSFSAYAYFSVDVISGFNTIKAANFEAQITITEDVVNAPPVEASGRESGAVLFKFEQTGTYTVVLTEGSSTAKTGFCIISVGETKYYTQQIGVDINDNNNERSEVSFQLQINEAGAVVKFESHWGTSSHYGYDTTEKSSNYISGSDMVIVVGEQQSGEVNGSN